MPTVTDVMTRNVRTLASTDTVKQAAKAMAELNVGVIPVCDGTKLLGMVTDRDIVLRAVARGLDDKTILADVMSAKVRTALETADLNEVLEEMAANQIRRLPVVDSAHRLVGIISLGDIATKGKEGQDVGQSLSEISAPRGAARS